MIPYRKVSKNALINWKLVSSEEEASKMVAELSVDELDEKVDAKYSMTNAINGIANYLQQQGIELTAEEIEQYKHAVFYGPENAEIFSKIGEKIAQVKNPYQLMIAGLTSTHDGWARKFQEKFFAREKKHQHMPIELIGWEEVKSDLLFLKPMLEASGIKIDEETLKTAYYDLVKKFFESWEIKSEADLEAKIPEIANSYHALEGQTEILEKLNDPTFVKNVLMPQIKTKGIGADLGLIIEVTKAHVTTGGFGSASNDLRENYQEHAAEATLETTLDASNKEYEPESESSPITEDGHFGAGPYAYAVQKLYEPNRINTAPNYDGEILDDSGNKDGNNTDEHDNTPKGIEEEYDGQTTDDDQDR